MTPTPISDPLQLDALLLHFARPHILQSSHWAALKAPTWQSQALLWGEVEHPVAVANVLTRRLGRLPVGVQYVPKGPIVAGDSTTWSEVLAGLEQQVRQSGALFIKIDPDVDAESEAGQILITLLQKRGWVFSPDQIQFRNTVLSDLSQNEETLLAGMKQKTRYNIRLAARRGVQVHTSADFDTFYDLYAQTSQRDGFLIRPRDYYLRVMQRLQSAGLGQLLLAEVEGRPVAGVFLFRFGATAWYFYGASSNEHRRLMPNYLLQWEAMRWAKAQGCTTYDWWGAPNTLTESDPMWGVVRFKLGFGGSLRQWIGAWDYAPRPALYRLYTQFMPRILAILRRRAAPTSPPT
ncbi:MAG: peptidoglycan bridge formation glycyltransferase FemA/FemB family protein [Chloroflexi bacterium]|nr:peptidoglycan bridge formation glycyltransferase FemA/FemB family protein [Chloroflexota bacterium]